MKLAIVIVHNKDDQKNFDQIEFIKSLIVKVTDVNNEYDDDGQIIGTYDTYHYEIKDSDIYSQVSIYQIFPFGVTPPSNKNDISSHNVYYGEGDEDKVGDHPLFFNWGVKRGTDYGADVVIYLEDHVTFDIESLYPDLEKLNDVSDTTEYIENSSCKIVSFKLLKEIGKINEHKPMSQSIADLKQKVKAKGWKNV